MKILKIGKGVVHWYKRTDHSTFSCKISHILFSFLETCLGSVTLKLLPSNSGVYSPPLVSELVLRHVWDDRKSQERCNASSNLWNTFYRAAGVSLFGKQVALAYWKMRPRNWWQDTRHPNDKMRPSNICQSPANLVPWVRSKVKPSKTESICSPGKTSSNRHCAESYNKKRVGMA